MRLIIFVWLYYFWKLLEGDWGFCGICIKLKGWFGFFWLNGMICLGVDGMGVCGCVLYSDGWVDCFWGYIGLRDGWFVMDGFCMMFSLIIYFSLWWIDLM